MNDEIKNKPPYLAYTTFKNFIASLNKNGIIPSRIDKTLMPGQSGATQSYLMGALRFFGLIDMLGAPEADLQTLAKGDENERKKVWKEIYERAYSPIIGDLDLARATLGMLNEKFAEQGYQGDTLRKSLSFFAAAAEDAGVVLAPQLKPKSRGGSSGPRRPRKKGNGKSGERSEDEFAALDEQTGVEQGGSQVATLLLDADGTRAVRIKAPARISSTELERIQKWLSFQ